MTLPAIMLSCFMIVFLNLTSPQFDDLYWLLFTLTVMFFGLYV
ncbi:hypothetical protein AAHH84_00010 [Candidatus Hodgkinia cicadicola]